jgi:hypothetical protein
MGGSSVSSSFWSLEPKSYADYSVPDRIAGPSKMEAIQAGVDFLKDVYKKHGWEWH